MAEWAGRKENKLLNSLSNILKDLMDQLDLPLYRNYKRGSWQRNRSSTQTRIFFSVNQIQTLLSFFYKKNTTIAVERIYVDELMQQSLCWYSVLLEFNTN